MIEISVKCLFNVFEMLCFLFHPLGPSSSSLPQADVHVWDDELAREFQDECFIGEAEEEEEHRDRVIWSVNCTKCKSRSTTKTCIGPLQNL